MGRWGEGRLCARCCCWWPTRSLPPTSTLPSHPPPPLARRRVLNNVAYFVGRALAGEDSLAPLTGRAALYARRVEWVRERRGWIVDTLAPLVVGGAAAASSASD